jgi:hypothetical protein
MLQSVAATGNQSGQSFGGAGKQGMEYVALYVALDGYAPIAQSVTGSSIVAVVRNVGSSGVCTLMIRDVLR